MTAGIEDSIGDSRLVLSDFIEDVGAEQALDLSAATAAAMIEFLSETGIDPMDFINRMIAGQFDGAKNDA